jgi:hypothetical protein
MLAPRAAAPTLLIPLLLAGRAPSAPPAPERLLPAATLAVVAVPNVKELRARWGETDLSRFFNDPALKPFRDDSDRQLPRGAARFLGLSADDVTRVAEGTAAFAIVPGDGGRPADVLLIDATGKDAELRKVLGGLAQFAQQRGGLTQEEGGLTVHAWTAGTPPQARRIAHAVKEGLFVASDSPAVAREVLTRWGGGENLAGRKAFQATAERCKTPGGQPVHLSWFLDPIGLADAQQAAAPPAGRKRSNTLAVVKKQGLDAVQAVGGVATVAAGGDDLVYRAFVYAPPPRSGYRNAAGMLKFPAGGDFAPPPWVPAELSVFESFYWDLPQAFESFAPLFDQVAGDGEEGTFKDVIDSLRDDPNGPQLDFRKEIIAQLSGRVNVVTDCLQPVTRKSERVLVAFEARPKSSAGDPEQTLADAMRKSMQGDPQVKRRDFQGKVIWEIQAREPKKSKKGEVGVKLPNAAIAVAHGQLFVATHVSLLEKALLRAAPAKLADQADYQRVTAELQRLAGGSKPSVVLFARPAEDFRATYELTRMNQLEGAESVYAKVLLSILKRAEADGSRVTVNGSLLPEFGQVNRHLGPAGTVVVSHPDGWSLVGVQMKQVP